MHFIIRRPAQLQEPNTFSALQRHSLYVRTLTLALLGAVAAFPLLSVCEAQRTEPLPTALDEVGIDEKIGDIVPLEAVFRDSRGEDIRLAEILNGQRPAVLSLTYSDCPMLCHLQLEGMIRTLRNVDWSPGDQFDVVNISIDPGETWQRAAVTKKKHLDAYGRPGTADGWHFLTGDEATIRRVADSVGFRYRFVPKRNEYAHAAGLVLLTPNGKVSRYLYGVDYDPQSFRLSLVEAAEGKVGSALDRVLLFCFHYDAATGRYAPAAFRIMQLGGIATVVALLTGLLPYWWRGRRRRLAEHRRAESKRDHAPAAAVGEGKSSLPSASH